MHPDVCRFVSEAFYEGRLRVDAECAPREATPFGTGLRWLPVEHDGQPAVARGGGSAIAREIERLLGGTCTRLGGASGRCAATT